MLDLLMLGVVALLTLAVWGITLWSTHVVNERSDGR